MNNLIQSLTPTWFVIISSWSLFCLGCQPKLEPRPLQPNIILITIDALNATRLSCYGCPRPTTPTIDAIAAEGIRFTRAWSTSSWTAPAMSSLFSGYYPRTHGVRHGLIEHRSLSIRHQEMLSDSIVTLAESFQQAGYYTIGVNTNPHLAPDLGFNQGFEVYIDLISGVKTLNEQAEDDPRLERGDGGEPASLPEEARALPSGFLDLEARKVTSAALEALAGCPQSKPYLLWVHYLDAHWPYVPMKPWIDRYFSSPKPQAYTHLEKLLFMRQDVCKLDPESESFAYLQAAYDSEVSYCDEQIGRLLKSAPASDNAVVVITADHGEAFMEHGFLGHRNNLYEEELRIPLILRLPAPRPKPAVIKEPISLLDIPPTLYELAGITVASPLHGSSLRPLFEGVKRGEAIYAELTDYSGCEQVAITTGRWKLLTKRGAGDKELLDLLADMRETRNLAAAKPEQVRLLTELITQWEQIVPYTESEVAMNPLSEERQEHLRALGYITDH